MAAAVEEAAKRKKVVLFPSPGMGHIVSMYELGKLLVQKGLDVTIAIVDAPYNTAATATFIARVSATNTSISFHRLPPVPVPPSSSLHHEVLAFSLLRFSTPALLSFVRADPPRALVVDVFCTYALDAASELRIPCHIFYTSGAAVLGTLLCLPALHAATDQSFRELGSAPLLIPGLPPLRADHMPLPLLDRGDEAYEGLLYHCSRYPDAHGIIVNTFGALEPRALEAVVSGRCVVDDRVTPRIYAIGPLITTEAREKVSSPDCFRWLDGQPRASVVFLCFGSMGVFSAAQLKEIAVGLERSGQRFLWVVRAPPSDDPAKRYERSAELDLHALLPEGFLESTRGRGLVVKSWAPQAEVLRHEAVGGFVTHCGWNSVLEAVVAGVPMLAWPLYAEQWMNKVFLVEEMRLAVTVEGYDKELVPAEEVEGKVRWLMESEGGRELGERMAEMKRRSEEAVGEGGSSREALTELVTELTGETNGM